MHITLYAFLFSGCVSVSPKKASPAEVAAANVNLAAEYFRLGRMEPALVAAKKAVAANDDSVAANVMLALIYQSLEEPLLAEPYYIGAIEHVSEETGEFGSVHNNYAVFLCQNKRWLDADEHFLLAVNNKLYATPQGAYENAGVCALNAGKTAKAKKYFRKALALSPNMPRSLFELAKIQYNAEKYLSASVYFKRYHAVSKGTEKSLLMALTAEQKIAEQSQETTGQISGDTEQVLRIKTELKKRFPDSQEVGRRSKP